MVAERLTAAAGKAGVLGVSFLVAAMMCSKMVSDAKPEINPTSTESFGVSGSAKW